MTIWQNQQNGANNSKQIALLLYKLFALINAALGIASFASSQQKSREVWSGGFGDQMPLLPVDGQNLY